MAIELEVPTSNQEAPPSPTLGTVEDEAKKVSMNGEDNHDDGTEADESVQSIVDALPLLSEMSEMDSFRVVSALEKESDDHDIDLANVPPVTLSFKNISYSVPLPDDSTKEILRNINGCIRPGEMLAVMGPTGAGKSSLLNILAGSTKGSGLSGEVLMNGRKNGAKSLKRLRGYVLQDDTFFTQLTVRETLTYSALLRLPKSMSKAEKIERVDRVIKLLNIEKCQHTIVGGPMVRGVSGGERRRLNIGNELLANPSLLLLDEPTSGLDSSTAHSVLRTLKGIAREGRTIVATIHQPSSRMFSMFDKFLLLAQGRVVYYGPTKHVVDYLSRVGHPSPLHYNPADFVLELVTEEELSKGKKVVQHLADIYQEYYKRHNVEIESYRNDYHHRLLRHGGSDSQTGTAPASGVDSHQITVVEHGHEGDRTSADYTDEELVALGKSMEAESRWVIPFWDQMVILTERSWKQSKGERMSTLYFWQYFSMSLIIALLWWQMDKDEPTVKDRVGVIFFVAIFWCFQSMFTALMVFPSHRAVLMKERAAGAYRLSAYFIATTVSEIGFDMVYPSMMVFLTYWPIGLEYDADRFFLHWFIMLLLYITGKSVGFMISASVMDFEKSLIICGVAMLAMMLSAGYYIPVERIPVFVRWARYLAFPSYGYFSLVQNDLQGSDYDCPSNVQEAFYQECKNGASSVSGDSILDHDDFNVLTIGGNIAVLFVFSIVCRTIAYVMLRRLKP